MSEYTPLDIYRLLDALDPVTPLDPAVICRRLGLPAAVIGHVGECGWAVPAGKQREDGTSGVCRTVAGSAALAGMLAEALREWGGVRVPRTARIADRFVLRQDGGRAAA